MKTGPILTEKIKEARLAKSVKMMNKLKHPKKQDMMWLFSDQKIFCQDQAHNRQNNRWVAINNSDVPRVMKTKFLANVMVCGVVSSKGDVMPPHIFAAGLRVNTEIYLKMMRTKVLPG